MRYVFGDYELDEQLYELHRAGETIELERKVFDVLAYLIEHRDRLVTKDELKERGQPPHSFPLLIIRGVYDGKTFRALPTELVPAVSREVSVAILFLEDVQMEPESVANEVLPNPLWQPQAILHGTFSFNGLKEEK